MKRKINQRATADFSGTLEEFIARLREWVDLTVPHQYRNTAHISVEREEYPYSDHVSAVLQLTWTRPETDEEEIGRNKVENTYKANRFMQYQELKKEFGE